jgi:hypothetical protein
MLGFPLGVIQTPGLLLLGLLAEEVGAEKGGEKDVMICPLLT